MTFESEECRLVWDFFSRSHIGIFVEVGANYPVQFNQTWFLEQQGWTGVLIEPNPDLTQPLREQRPCSQIFQVAVANPAQPCETTLYLAGQHFGLRSSILASEDRRSQKTIQVPLRTLDSILVEAGVAQVDFLSIDVEGLELEVLQGFDMKKFRPKLILIEDHRHDFKRHFYLRRQNYRLVKRTGLNNWYVPVDSPVSIFKINSCAQIFRMWRKMWLNAPLNIAYSRVVNYFCRLITFFATFIIFAESDLAQCLAQLGAD